MAPVSRAQHCPLSDWSQLLLLQKGPTAAEGFKKGETVVKQQLGERRKKLRETALQTTRSVQKGDRKCSRHRAEALCSPGEACGGAGCPPAAHGHYAEQISMCRHGGVHVAEVDEA